MDMDRKSDAPQTLKNKIEQNSGIETVAVWFSNASSTVRRRQFQNSNQTTIADLDHHGERSRAMGLCPTAGGCNGASRGGSRM
jgi:hypothetical protein